MERRRQPLSPFGELLKELCSKQGYSLYRLARELELTSYALISKSVRPHRNGKRAGLFSPHQIDQIADILKCDQEVRYKLHLLSALEYAPEILSKIVDKLQQDLTKTCAKAGEYPPAYVLVGQEISVKTNLDGHNASNIPPLHLHGGKKMNGSKDAGKKVRVTC